MRREVSDTRPPAIAKVTYGAEAGVIPRAYGWLRTPQGRARRVTILFDSGASHNFVHPRVVRELGLLPDPSHGPTHLKVADDRVIQCDGAVTDVEIVTTTIKGGPSYIERSTFCTADIGADDIILGDPSLKSHEGGHGPLGSNTWKMVKSGTTYLIPLMTTGGDHAKTIETMRGTKKIKKLIQAHSNHLMRGHVWRRDEDDESTTQPRPAGREFNAKHRHAMTGLPWSHEHIAVSQLKLLEELLPAELRLTEAEVQAAMEYAAAKVKKDGSDSHGGQALNDTKAADKSTATSSLLDQQERDAEAGQHGALGEDFRPWETAGSVHSQTNSSSRTRLNAFKKRNRDLQSKIAAEKEQLKETSERIRTQIMTEFPTIFQEPQELPPTRWQEHVIDLEHGAKMPPVRGLPRLSPLELEETKVWVADMLKKGLIRPSMGPYASVFFFVTKPNGGLRGVCDFRGVNLITKKILPTLPLFENVVSQLEGANFFSGLDLTSMFYQLRIREEDIEKTAFRTAIGNYAYVVTPMGTTGSVGSTALMMQSALSHVISLPGETLPSNDRPLPPFPPQKTGEEHLAELKEDWQKFKYHSALGSYTALFVDDVLVYSKTEEEHIRHLRQLCKTFEQHKLFLNPKKCHFASCEVDYLGNSIGRYGVRPRADRTEALRNWPRPENVSELRSFLGLIGFLRRYIRDFAQIAVSLNALLKKGASWKWGEAEEYAFEKLKSRCTDVPVLAIPRRDGKLVLRTDASRYAMGCALYQVDEDGFLQPIEFKSKAFAPAQQKLAAHDRECLALLYALNSFRHFLLGKEFDVQTDNSALAQIFTSKDLSDLYSRWHWKLAQFAGMRIKHRKGRKMYCADSLSRRRPADADDKEPFFVEPGQLFTLHALSERGQVAGTLLQYLQEQANQEHPSNTTGQRFSPTTDGRRHLWDPAQWTSHPQAANGEQAQLIKRDRGAYILKIVHSDSDAHSAAVTETAQDPAQLLHKSAGYTTHTLHSSMMERYRQEWPKLYETDPDLGSFWKSSGHDRWEYWIQDGLLWKSGLAGARLCVPKGADKGEILTEIHDSKMSAHPGRYRTLAKAQGNYFWRGMYRDVDDFVASCDVCQKKKGDKLRRQGEARAPSVPTYPFETVHMDWITGLPTTAEGYDSILVFVCALSGMVHLQAARTSDTSQVTARHLVNNVVRLYGLPKVIISDRDVRLTSKFWKVFNEILGISKTVRTASYTPNSNGKVERANQVLGNTLRSLCNAVGSDWGENLALAEFAMNTAKHSSIDMSPFNLVHLREPLWPDTLEKPALDVPAAAEMADRCFAIFTRARDCLEASKLRTERALAAQRRAVPQIVEGDLVLLSTRNLRLKYPHVKLLPKFVGPFEVLQQPENSHKNPNNVWLKTPNTLHIHMPINVKDVRRYIARPQHLGGAPDIDVPLPVTVDGYDLWEIQTLLAMRTDKKSRCKQALVLWKGFGVESASWEPVANLPKAVLDAYYTLQQQAAALFNELDDDSA